MTIMSASRRTGAALALTAALTAGQATARAGEIANWATVAEDLLDGGNAGEALAAIDRSAAAFWAAAPLQLRVAAFADDVAGFGRYTPRPDPTYEAGDTLTVYLEPFGFGFMPDGDGFRSAIATDVEIRTPGGLILASAPDFGQLRWSGRTKMHEVHATIALPLPELKPGEYRLLITLRDQGSAKTATVTLPFTVAE
ncbi:MAG: hypothetical protein F9K43_03860 [Bauldia sp.]|nr:MAG: hypothetical protein F9K43_03860 [Bauldia sp.]